MESSETKFYFGPEVWTYVGENGEIMPTKKLYQGAMCYSPNEHGELERHGRFEGARWENKREFNRIWLEEQNASKGEPVIDATGTSQVEEGNI